MRALATAGADVVMCSRSVEGGQKVADQLQAEGGLKGKVTVKQLDLASLKSVKAFADDANKSLPRLDLLVLNAGVMACPLMRTADGFEMQARARALLGARLAPLPRQTAPPPTHKHPRPPPPPPPASLLSRGRRLAPTTLDTFI